MTKEEIIKFAEQLKKKFKTNNPFIIGEKHGIEFSSTDINPKACQAYVIKPSADIPHTIIINSYFDKRSQAVLCAHELGHALLHDGICNHFTPNAIDNAKELEANLFAVALLFNKEDFIMHITAMDNYLLKGILDENITY